MKILGINFGANNAPKNEEKKIEPVKDSSLIGLDLSNQRIDNFICELNSGRGYINFGLNNLYPETLKFYRSTCALHNSLLGYKERATTGKGYSIDNTSLKGMELVEVNQITQLFDGENSLQTAVEELASNYFMYGAMYVKITWNEDFTKVIKREVIPSDCIRLGFADQFGKYSEYYYCFDWRNTGKYPITKYAKFSPNNNKDRVQVIGYGIPTTVSNFYSLPTFYAADKWLQIQAGIAEAQDANIKNSIQPSIVIITKKTGTKEQNEAYARSLQASFSGSKEKGRAMIAFAEKDYEPEIFTLTPNQLDKQFESLSDNAQRSILLAHNIAPVLIGYRTPSGLGNVTELPYAFELAKENVFVPAQKHINTLINQLFKLNGLNVNFRLNEPELILPATA